MPLVRVLTPDPYLGRRGATRRLTAEEARVLTLLGKVEAVEDSELAVAVETVAAPIKKKRRYKRRDMRAEE